MEIHRILGALWGSHLAGRGLSMKAQGPAGSSTGQLGSGDQNADQEKQLLWCKPPLA